MSNTAQDLSREITLENPFSRWVWEHKYRYKDETLSETFWRVANAVAAPEENHEFWARKFFEIMSSFEFVPGGRILAGAGTGRAVTLHNCYVMGEIDDSLDGILKAHSEAAVTLKQGGGVGMDFSTLRPRGAAVKSVDSESSGAVSFMNMWDAMCATIMSAGTRRGAMMGVLRVDHPDIEEFIKAKQTQGALTNFNISIGITDEFMRAVRNGERFDLEHQGTFYRSVDARKLWDLILKSTYEYSEPGIIFIDRVNRLNPLCGIEEIAASNPCGEQMLPPYGSCLLGSINLTKFVRNPFHGPSHINGGRLREVTEIAVRFLDNVIDISNYPLPEQEREAKNKRRIGLGVMGLADALTMMGYLYDQVEARTQADRVTQIIKKTAIETTQFLGKAKSVYPAYHPAHGAKRRNSHLMSIAPTGTTAAFAENVSSGVEPVFAYTGRRNVLMSDGSKKTFDVENYAYRLAKKMGVEQDTDFITAEDIAPEDHVAMVAALQPNIDSAISKTVNVPKDISFEDFEGVYDQAYDDGLKGCTTYRPSDVRGAVLLKADDDEKAPVPESGNVVQLTSVPTERPESVLGVTYKLKPPGSDHALYLTINNVIENDYERPFEIFISTQEMEGFQWKIALARMVSAVFRQTQDPSFVAEELSKIFDPQGGFWHGQKRVPSLCAWIGDTIKQHMEETCDMPQPMPVKDDPEPAIEAIYSRVNMCPKCNRGELVRREGCWSCSECDYSKCG